MLQTYAVAWLQTFAAAQLQAFLLVCLRMFSSALMQADQIWFLKN